MTSLSILSIPSIVGLLFWVFAITRDCLYARLKERE